MRAFAGAPARDRLHHPRGNPCQVSILAGPPADPPAPACSTQCATWPTAERQAEVRCWTDNARPIQCCGHGLLSCATLWLDSWGERGTLLTHATEVPCERSAEHTWVGLPLVETSITEIPHWLGSILAESVTRCALAGNDNGYLVAEIAEASRLEIITPPGSDLAGHTDRALIVCCAASDKDPHGADILYRYFAPQYGVVEDIATGSAMRVLAGYWRDRDLGTELTAWQCSAEGGLLYSAIRDGLCWVGGLVVEDSDSV